jgi:hypothetical protein
MAAVPGRTPGLTKASEMSGQNRGTPASAKRMGRGSSITGLASGTYNDDTRQTCLGIPNLAAAPADCLRYGFCKILATAYLLLLLVSLLLSITTLYVKYLNMLGWCHRQRPTPLQSPCWRVPTVHG